MGWLVVQSVATELAAERSQDTAEEVGPAGLVESFFDAGVRSRLSAFFIESETS